MEENPDLEQQARKKREREKRAGKGGVEDGLYADIVVTLMISLYLLLSPQVSNEQKSG